MYLASEISGLHQRDRNHLTIERIVLFFGDGTVRYWTTPLYSGHIRLQGLCRRVFCSARCLRRRLENELHSRVVSSIRFLDRDHND